MNNKPGIIKKWTAYQSYCSIDNGIELFTCDQNEASRRLINKREKRWIIRN